MKQFLSTVKEYLTQKNLLILASLPLFVNWYLVLLFFYENEEIRKQTLRTALLSFVFFLVLILSWLVSKLPFLGSLLANGLHLFGIVFYISSSVFFVYKIYTNQKLDTSFLDIQVKKLESLLQ